jgi:poly(A) polymerase
VKPKVYHASDHDIDPAQVDADALSIIKKLKDAGFSAYLVGGSVRDLLVKKTPKDFDISTSARPEQIKHLFNRQCLLIGRRFRLAHIRFGHKIFEVSTFRAGMNESDLILHDNQWGTEEEDVLRRDFTINGLFYDPNQHAVIDYVNGWEDIHNKTLRVIGDPAVRFKQDPVRMIRLLKFKARFDFEIDPGARKALIECRDEIIKSSPARILEEMMRMLESGASAPFFHLMTEAGMLDLLFPPLAHFLKGPHGNDIYRYLACADKIHQTGKGQKESLDRSVLTACLLYPILEKEVETQFLKKNLVPNFNDVMLLTYSIIKAILMSSFSHFPKRISSSAAFIMGTQYRLTPVAGKRNFRTKLLSHHEFEWALQLLKIRAHVNERLLETYTGWKQALRQNVRHGDRRSHHPPPHHAKQPQA